MSSPGRRFGRVASIGSLRALDRIGSIGPTQLVWMVWTPPFRRRVRQNGVWFELQTEGASTMDITTIGFDLAKTVFQVHGC